MHVQEMLRAHPAHQGVLEGPLGRCVEECFSCAQACVTCADACLAEDDVAELVLCIRLNLDCADICFAAGAVMSRRTGQTPTVWSRLLEACAEACHICADVCERHEHHDHCRICAEACRACEAVCRVASDLAPRELH